MPTTFHLLSPREAPALLSIVIPIYNEEESIPILSARLEALFEILRCEVEVILVNDGSSDRSVILLRDLTLHDPRFKLVCFARNFGHQAAATAGLDAARGDAILLMDADLQDPPELVIRMLEEYRKGYDVVYGQRVRREGESALKRFSAWLFYRLMKLMVYADLPPDVGDFRLVSRRCLQAVNSMREMHRFLRGMVSWVGFPQTAIPFVRMPRIAGHTKYPLAKMLKFAWTAAVSFSPSPLRASFLCGGMLFGVGTVFTIYAVVRIVLGLYVVTGWTSIIVLNFLTGGAIMIAIGVLGEYVARIFEENKGRPLYVVSDQFNLEPLELPNAAIDANSTRSRSARAAAGK